MICWLIIRVSPSEYLGDAAIGDLEYPGDVTRPRSLVSQLHYLLPGGVRQRPAVDVDAAELVHSAVTCIRY